MCVGYKTVPYNSKNDHINIYWGEKKPTSFLFIYSQCKLTKTSEAALCLDEQET